MKSEAQFAQKIGQLLNQDLRLTPAQAERLRAARERALAAQNLAPGVAVLRSGRFGLALVGGPTFASRVAISLLFLIIGMIGVAVWQDNQQAADVDEIDAAVLTGELPVDAYLDNDFDAWLKQSSE